MLEGLYENLITKRLQEMLLDVTDLDVSTDEIDAAEQPDVLARHVRDAAVRAFKSDRDPERRRLLVNRLLDHLDASEDVLSAGPNRLLALTRRAVPGGGHPRRTGLRPSTPLSDAALLTNAHGEPSLGSELRAELDSADQVDLLCAFVKWHGIRVLEPELKRLHERRVPFRVITTTYMGATERVALDRLVSEFGAEVKIQYDAVRTRLHAKAWLFQRNTGFHTAYVGSSNLSRSALLEGVEWNVRLSAIATPPLMQKFSATFDTYWNDPTFESYDVGRDRDRLDDALAEASGRRASERVTLSLSGLQVRPYPYQAEMLEALEVERTVHDRHRNLVVAATGTGKTVVAALDYQRLAEGASPERPSLLFVAHRKEILEQSVRTYREVLGDPGFGELYVGGARPERWSHVFASVQSLHSYGVANIPRDAFEIVVIDEFHHAEASTYRRILQRLEPAELLGLTATPERADGVDVRSFFGGRTAAELRLWDALNTDLLCPFHYFGVADGVDLSHLDWRRGAYDVQGLSRLYTGNDSRARVVLTQLRDKVADLSSMKALGFCVSIDHAQYMARVFRDAGIPAVAVTSDPHSEDRDRALVGLKEGPIKVIFTVDMFNEGVDVPAVDTVLFLRPTESATVFLQQLGRGLRRERGKAVCTVLDFVGHQRREFRFDARYRAITGSTRTGLKRQVEQGFPFLPAGSQIVLDRQTQENVLANLQSQIGSRWAEIVSELRRHPTNDLATFTRDSGVELADILRSDRSWTRLRREAGLLSRSTSPNEVSLLKRVRAFAHVDDPERAAAYRRWLSDDPLHYEVAPPRLAAYGRMLFFSLWPDGGGFRSYAEGLGSLRGEDSPREDLRQVVAIGLEAAQHVTTAVPGALSRRALRTHARYTREEVVAAIDYVSIEGRKPNSFREGVLFSEPAQTDAFFVTLKKSETDYSPTTMYHDYAISPTLFHWESQSVTTLASKTGQRYVHHRERGTQVLLFARPQNVTEFGSGAPYLCLGTARYLEHRGERPMAITWQLDVPMPVDVFTVASVVA